jgi:hypothetical protein
MRVVGCVVLSCSVSLVHSFRAWAGADELRIASRQFQIPVWVDPAQRENIKEVQLFVSADDGKTWQQFANLRRHGEGFPFRFEAPREGTYWFKLRIIRSDGTREPRDLSSAQAALKVRVGAGEPNPHKDTPKDVQELTRVLRQQFEQLEKRLSGMQALTKALRQQLEQIEKAKQK